MNSSNLSQLLSLDAIRTERASRSLKQFVKQAWHVLEADSEFQDNWHIDAVCQHLEAVTDGRIPRLIINVPPGHMKSLTVCVFWPAWAWINRPHLRFLFASYSSDLSRRDNIKTNILLTSQWYQQRWGDKCQIIKGTEAKIVNSKMGFRIASSTGGVGTGERVHFSVNDDLLRANDAHSLPMRKQAIEHLRAMSTRGVDPKTYGQVLIMQRLHEADPAGWAMANGQWEHLCLPAEYEPNRPCKTSLGFEDPRTVEGELLWPARFPSQVLAEAKKSLGSFGFASQFQQRPSPDGGGIFKREWWRYYSAAPSEFLQIVQSWDTAFKTGQENDQSVCTTWGIASNGYYLLDRWAGKLEYPELKRQAVALRNRWLPNTVLIEDKASGQSLLQELRRETDLPLIGINPDRDKTARAYAVTPQIESGNVYLPQNAEWLSDFMDEFDQFPNGLHDDQVDSVTQALGWLLHNPSTGLLDFYAAQSKAERDYENGR